MIFCDFVNHITETYLETSFRLLDTEDGRNACLPSSARIRGHRPFRMHASYCKARISAKNQTTFSASFVSFHMRSTRHSTWRWRLATNGVSSCLSYQILLLLPTSNIHRNWTLVTTFFAFGTQISNLFNDAFSTTLHKLMRYLIRNLILLGCIPWCSSKDNSMSHKEF